MIDIDEKVLKLRHSHSIKGNKFVIVNILKGDHAYKGRYLLSITDDSIYFYQLGLFYNYKKKSSVDFRILLDSLIGYRFAFEKMYYKRITLLFKDELEFAFTFFCEHPDSGKNEKNAIEVMNKLKEKGIFQKNNLKGGKRAQRTISKRDQLFIKEVRSPSKK